MQRPYKNGRLYWLRVRDPLTGTRTPRSTGTDNEKIATKVSAMLDVLADDTRKHVWLTRAARGDVGLDLLYAHWSRGSLDDLALQLEDGLLDEKVREWAAGELAAMDVSERTRADYLRQVRALVPEGSKLRLSGLTQDVVRDAMLSLRDPKTGELVSGSTRRRYIAAWRLFFGYLGVNPLRGAKWLPTNAGTKPQPYDHETRLRVLAHMEGEARRLMTLIFGTGMELGAALAGRAGDLQAAERLILARGTKTQSREHRTIFIDEWALPAVVEQAEGKAPHEPLWTITEQQLRTAFYWAQVKAGLIDEPPFSKSRKRLWHAVSPHTIHHARHTYVVCRVLGLDGEPRQDLSFCAMQLGHADEQMVMTIYNKTNLRERLKLILAREAQERAAKAQTEKVA